MKIGLIVGSLRKESWNRKVAEVVKELFPKDIEVDFIDISYVPFYNQDLDGSEPIEEYERIREDVKQYDGYIFFTPEYNRSVAPALKNVIDVVSVNSKGNYWNNKPVAVFSASIGGFGGMGSNLSIRQSFSYVNLIVLEQPEVFLSKVNELFDEDGNMVENTKEFLQKAVDAYVAHAKK